MGTRNKVVADGPFIALLVALSVQNLIAINLITPGLPALSGQLGVSAAAARLVMPAFFAPYAASLLACGPISDWSGRRPVHLVSLSVFLLGSIFCSAAGSLPMLLCGRVLQGLGAGGGTVMALAIARDCFEGPAFVRVVSYINAGRSLAPALAPVVGGVLVEHFGGWRPPFIVAALLGALLFCMCFLWLRETLLEKRKDASLAHIISDYRHLVTSMRFLSPALASAFAFGAWFTYVVGSPAVLITQLGVSPAQYGLCHGTIVAACIMGSLLVGRLVGRVPSWQVMFGGLVLLCGGSLVTTLLTLSGVVSVASIVVPMCAVSTGYGIIFSTSSAQAMVAFAKKAASSFALIGFICMCIATISTACMEFVPGGPAIAFSTIMIVMAVSSACASMPGHAVKRKSQADDCGR